MRWLIRAAAILLAGALVYDVTRAPAQQVGARLAVAGIQRYQRTLSPFATRAGVACRFAPTCSHYAEMVIARDGVLRGGWLALRRIVRCGPWTPAGTKDPP